MKIVYAFALVSALVMAEAAIRNYPCLRPGSSCGKTTYPCCGLIINGGITMGYEPVVCFKFGKKTCRGARRIKNFSLYRQLEKKLNGTNFKDISAQYWSSVG